MVDATVLIVDDDRTIVRLCQRLLERSSYQVITAIDPIEGLKVLEQQKVDLLLSDIRMPIMDGFEMITRAKQYQPDLPVLVMTGYGSIDNAIQALHRGVDGLLLKPFENSAELVQTVQRVLEESRQKRDAARLQALRPLFDVTERLLAETSPQLLERLIDNTVTTVFQARFAWIFHMEEDGSGLKMVYNGERENGSRPPELDLALMREILVGRSPVLGSRTGPISSPAIQDLLSRANLGTIMLAPILQKGSLVIFTAGRESGSPPFTEADLEMFVILARQAGVAMENARLYSELKDNIRRVEESQQALIQAEKMAAVGRLAASLAHEINNPLQAVRNCLHLAGRKGIDTDQRLRYLEMTDSELERLVTTIRRMLDFYRPGGVEKENADLQQLIDRVLAILAPQLRDLEIVVHVQYRGKIRAVEIVADQIQQVIFNLVLNAMDAIEEGAAANPASQQREKAIWIDAFYEDRQVRILVEDSGMGIPEGMRESIFEPFISTKRHGTGLGLAVSYGIMERHQGSLSVVSPTYGDGACFEMLLPVGVDAQNG